jgi:DNA polymerase III delta prime subunit
MTEQVPLQWEMKHHPVSLDEMVLKDEIKTYFRNQIAQNDVPSMTLYGIQGTGKTTLARMLPNLLGEEKCVSMFVHCGKDNGIDMVRDKLTDFCEAFYPGKLKIAVIDEADSMTGSASMNEDSSAQKAFRSITHYKDVRFILTCNVLAKLSPAVQSRCRPIRLQFETTDVLKRCLQILKMENVRFSKETVSEFFENVIKSSYPDVRSIVAQLQMWSVTGELRPVQAVAATGEIDEFAVDLIDKIKSGMSCRKISEHYISNEAKFSADYEKLLGAMFKQLYDRPKAQLLISNGIFQMQSVFDREIQMYATLLQIAPLVKDGVIND